MEDQDHGSPEHDMPGAGEFFDPAWYRTTYPDTAEMEPWQHFLRHGDFERRSPGPDFDGEFYASTYLALEERDPLRHFLTGGRSNGYVPRPIPRSAAESQAAMAAALAGAATPIVLIGNDAQRAGAPFLLLEISRHLRRLGWAPVFVLVRGGPLVDQFRVVGPTLLVAEGHDVAGLGAALDPAVPILANTGWAAPILEALDHPGPSALLIHEMPDYLVEQNLIGAVGRSPLVVAGLPVVASALAAVLPPSCRVEWILPGLLHTATGPQSAERVRRLLAEQFGADRLVVLGAGFADARKGFDRFLALAREVHDLDPRSAFVWLGDLGAWADGHVEQARADGLPLLLPGFRIDASAWYDNADVYLLTSRQDPGPTTVMDAARRGVPFVAAPGDLGLPSLGAVLEGVGWFIDDERQVAARLLEVVRAETEQRRAERQRHVESLAGFGRYVDELLEVLSTQPRP